MIIKYSELSNISSSIDRSKSTITLVSGFFDALHREHILFLQKAKKCGDYLIVAVESDERATAIKGINRPFESQLLRCKKIEATGLADWIVALSPDFASQAAYDEFMQKLRPDYYAVSSHTDYLDNKRYLTEKYGGQLVIVHQHNPQVSTTLAHRKNQG